MHFYKEEGADIDLAEVVDRFPYLQRIDIDGTMRNLVALEQCEHLEILSVHRQTKTEALDISKIKRLQFFGFDVEFLIAFDAVNFCTHCVQNCCLCRS